MEKADYLTQKTLTGGYIQPQYQFLIYIFTTKHEIMTPICVSIFSISCSVRLMAFSSAIFLLALPEK